MIDFARHELGATMLVPSHSRYVVDLNRPPDGVALYPGRRETGLVPTIRFDGEPVYLDGQAPDTDEIRRRVDTYWRPYHDALAAEIARVHAEHGRVVLWEAHSIRSHVPRFFDGRLPDFNFGTSSGASAAPGLAEALAACVSAHGGYTAVANGRFKGGYITRHYGVPETGVEAVQLELSQITYMEETRPYAYDEARAAQIVPLLQTLVETALAHR